jgi:repressor LexA
MTGSAKEIDGLDTFSEPWYVGLNEYIDVFKDKSMLRLTTQQAGFLRQLLDYKRREGVPPTIREMMDLGGFRSTRSVIQYLDALETAGYITRPRPGARNIRFVASPPPEISEEHASMVPIPVVGHVAAGTPILAEENIEEHLQVSRALAKPPFMYYLLRVHGTSMNQAGIDDGDLVLVRQQPAADPGDKVVALIDGAATVKYYRPARGAVILAPASTDSIHKPLILNEDFSIQGVVVATIPQDTGRSDTVNP